MIFYRYALGRYATGSEEYGFTSEVKLIETVYNLLKETPKGYWILFGSPLSLHSDKIWVSKTGKKRHAYPTKEEALVNYIKRTEKRISFLDIQKSDCNDGLYLAEKLLKLTQKK